MSRPADSYLAARLDAVIADSPMTVTINLVNAAVLAFVMRNVLPLSIPMTWFGFIAVIMALRFALLAWYRQSDRRDDAEAEIWLRRLTVLTTCTGVAWGVGCVVVMVEAPPFHKVFTAFVLGGMASGALPSLARVFTTYALFVIPVLAPAIVYFAVLATEISLSMSAMGAVLLGFLLVTGRRQEAVVLQSLRLAGENRDLVRSLTDEKTRALEEKAKSDRLNEELRLEIADRQRVEARLRDREKIFDAAQRIANLGSWEWDIVNDRIVSTEQNNLLFGRDMAAKSYGYDAALNIVHPDDRGRVDRVIKEALAAGRPYNCDYRILLPDGGERVIMEQADVDCDESGRAVRVTGINIDITERYRAEQDLRVAKQQAEEASEAKSRFLANMSHELRTPLNAIIGYSEILKEDAVARGEDDSISDLDRINTAGRHLLELINGLLDVARIEAGHIELYLEAVNPALLVREVAETVAPLVATNGNRLVLDCADDVGEMHADVTKLRQILYNLLSNAAKFTENGEIRLSVSRLRDSSERGGAEWIRFTVSDTGIGIDPQNLDSVFTAFERSEASRNVKYGGTGLGLAICRHYCELLGGAISLESSPGTGSAFTVRLPARASGKPPAQAMTAE